jgi:ABC-type antimicrobial peptide transport system permease subunit
MSGEPTRLAVRDVAAETVEAVLGRPMRAFLTGACTAIGAGLLVAARTLAASHGSTPESAVLLILAGICLVAGFVAISVSMLAAVRERADEIGLRRALGAQRGHVAVELLAESGGLGLFGGVVGACLGLAAGTLVATVREWQLTLDPLGLAAAPALGLLMGLLACAYPARRATRLTPAHALVS